jgi:hypothetical protein
VNQIHKPCQQLAPALRTRIAENIADAVRIGNTGLAARKAYEAVVSSLNEFYEANKDTEVKLTDLVSWILTEKVHAEKSGQD